MAITLENMTNPPPDHILTSFQVPSAKAVQLDDFWSHGWRCDHAVLIPVTDSARASWQARIMDKLSIEGVTVSRPIRSADGRLTVAGWSARKFESGQSAPRFDAIAAVSLAINEALKETMEMYPELDQPKFFQLLPPGEIWDESAIYTAAEAAACADEPAQFLAPALNPRTVPRPDIAQALEQAAELLPLRQEIQSPSQLVHNDMLSCLIFDSQDTPVLTGLSLSMQPAGWTVAQTVIDALAWAGAEDDLLDRWDHIPEWDQILLRVVLKRLFLHAILPKSNEQAWRGLRRISRIMVSRLSA